MRPDFFPDRIVLGTEKPKIFMKKSPERTIHFKDEPEDAGLRAHIVVATFGPF